MNYQIDKALSQLDEIHISRFEYPAEDAAILDRASCCFLAALIRVIDARKVLEYGSGFSSLMIAREIEHKKGAYLYSIDNSAKYSHTGKELLSASCSGLSYDFLIAPLRPAFYNGRLLIGHRAQRKMLLAKGLFDMACIDIPNYNRYICESAAYTAFSVLKTGGYIVIANANSARPLDKKWKCLFGKNAKFHYLDGLSKGIMLIEKIKNGKAKPLGFFSSLAESCRTLKYILSGTLN